MSNTLEDFKNGKVVIVVYNEKEHNDAIELLKSNGIDGTDGFIWYNGFNYMHMSYNCFTIDSMCPSGNFTFKHIEDFKRNLNTGSSNNQGSNPIMERQYFEMVDIMIKIAKEK